MNSPSKSVERAYFIVNLSHLRREHPYVTVWRPDNAGYAWPLSWAGRYPESRASLDYYNSGSNVAVPCEVLEALAVAPETGLVDNDAGPVVPSNATNWKRILRSVIEPARYRLVPVYKRARGKERLAYRKTQ